VSRDFLLQVFYESSSPRPLIISLGSFQIRGDIGDQGAPPESTMMAAANLPQDVVDTGSKFAHRVVNTGGKFSTSVVDTGGAT